MLQCVRSCVLRPADPSMAGGIHPPQLDYGRGNYGMRKTVSKTSLVSVSSVSDASILLFHASILKSYPFMQPFAYLHPFQLSNLAIHSFCPFLPSSLHSYMKTDFRFRPCPTGAVWNA